MSVPMFILRQVLRPYGRRLSRREIPKWEEGRATAWKLTHCKVCAQFIACNAVYRGGDAWHMYCDPDRSRTPIVTGFVANTRGRWADRDKEVAAGNLPEAEYRFWVGSSMDNSRLSICRACNRTLYGAEHRAFHKEDKSVQVDGNCCSVRLVNAYKVLLRKQKCVVCGGKTLTTRWGVPLCMDPDKSCHREFKFGTIPLMPIQIELMQQSRAGDNKEDLPIIESDCV